MSYATIVEHFFKMHDPTTKDRQGPDWGRQYRSVIFFHSPEQERIAREVLEKAQPNFKKKIVTLIEPAQTFYRAEEYHQQYLAKRGAKSCHI